MSLFRIFLLLVFSWFFRFSYGQNLNSILFINEISQGIQDSQEYVEFVVFGAPGCQSVRYIDMRGFVLDDNNGEYLPATSPGANISAGAIRFSMDYFWYAIPQGTIIVIYNENNRNPAIPPDDFSMSDGNGRLILPANSNLLEGQSVNPSNTSTASTGPWTVGGGLWSYVSMANDGDTFRANYYEGIPYFQAVSWGTNLGTPQVSDTYFPGSAAGLVFYADLHTGTASMVSGPATTHQTPGSPNTPQNALFIQQASSINSSLQLSLDVSPESCFNTCDAAISAQVSGGTAPYTYSWNVSGSGNVSTLQNKCPGTYSVTITDANGCNIQSTATVEAAEQFLFLITQTDETCANACDGTASVTTFGGSGPVSITWSQGTTGTELTNLCSGYYTATVQDANGCNSNGFLQLFINPAPPATTSVFTTPGPFLVTDLPIQLQNSVPGGSYTTTDCSGCLTASGIFDPATAGEGVFEVCYTLPNGNCPTTNCISISVNPCIPKQTSETITICAGDSVMIFGNWESQQDLFSHTFQGNNCDSIHQVTLLHHHTPDLYVPVTFCAGDSVFILGNWIDSAGVYSQEMESFYGCAYTKYVTISESFCPDEALIYIPNSFTPNNDQINDIFRIELLGATVEEGFIFNRWGEIIAHFDNENLTWNGTNERGELSPDGMYTYLIRYTPMNGSMDQLIGHVSLLR